jgi:hypothetical protein
MLTINYEFTTPIKTISIISMITIYNGFAKNIFYRIDFKWSQRFFYISFAGSIGGNKINIIEVLSYPHCRQSKTLKFYNFCEYFVLFFVIIICFYV